ncbi:MAG: hypothetical protein WHV44_13265 [Anaerolineales bacterium]
MDVLIWAAVAAMAVSSIGLVISRDWRKHLVFLAVQYLGMFVLLREHWPLTMSAAKLITGWMTVAVIGMTQSRLIMPEATDVSWPQGRIFRLLTSALVVLVVLTLAPRLSTFLPGITDPEVIGGLLLVGMGLLHLGITVQPARVIFGILTVLCGFEIVYASVENSIVVAAMLSAITLGLALLGAYLLTAETGDRA